MRTAMTSAADDRVDARAAIGGRRVGMLLLAVVMVLLIWAAAVHGRGLPGEPTAAPVPAAPRVGDCIQVNPHDRAAELYPAAAPLPVLRSGDCSGLRYGEIVSLLDGVPDGADVPVGATRQCVESAFSYLGIPGPPPAPELPVGPAVSVWYTLAGPDDRQRAAGQSWVACVVFLPPSDDASAPVTIDHSLRGAWHQADDRRLFAQCLDQVGAGSANCRWPHRVEVISRRLGDPAASPEAVHEACTRDVVEALGSPAALNRGELSVLALPALPDPTGDGLSTGPGAVTADAAYVTNCMVSPTDTSRLLVASVRGLQDAPAPLK